MGYSFWAVTADDNARRVKATYSGPDLVVWAHKTSEALRKAAVEREQMAQRAQTRAARRA